jgi:hypothetical protein
MVPELMKIVQSAQHTSSAVADNVLEPEAEASPVPAINETMDDAREENKPQVESIAVATHPTSENGGDASMDEEDHDEDKGFTSIPTISPVIDPSLKPVERIITVKRRGAGESQLHSVAQLLTKR